VKSLLAGDIFCYSLPTLNLTQINGHTRHVYIASVIQSVSSGYWDVGIVMVKLDRATATVSAHLPLRRPA